MVRDTGRRPRTERRHVHRPPPRYRCHHRAQRGMQCTADGRLPALLMRNRPRDRDPAKFPHRLATCLRNPSMPSDELPRVNRSGATPQHVALVGDVQHALVRPTGQRDAAFMHTRLIAVAIVVCSVSACSGSVHTGSAAKASGRTTSSSAASESHMLCTAALHRPVAGSSLTTVGNVRDWERGGPSPLTPDPTRRPGRAAFPSASGADTAAWCTIGSSGNFDFYAAGPDRTAVKLESVGDLSGAVPTSPVPIP